MFNLSIIGTFNRGCNLFSDNLYGVSTSERTPFEDQWVPGLQEVGDKFQTRLMYH
jgi:hypothetical protein